MVREKRSQSGFTLLEVIVAIVIITALVASFSPLIATSVRDIRWSGSRTQSLYCLRGEMEKAVAAGIGESKAIVLRGTSQGGSIMEWKVKGKLIKVEEESQDGEFGECLVSFVIPKE